MVGGFRKVVLWSVFVIALAGFVFGMENIALYQSNPLNPKPLINSIPEIINFQIKDKDILMDTQEGFQSITIKGLDLINNSGLPNLPLKVYKIPIYGDLEFFNIFVSDIDYKEIMLEKNIIPYPQRDLFKDYEVEDDVWDSIYQKYGRRGELKKNEVVYTSEEYFPNKLVSANSGYDKDHNKFIYIRFYPVQYNPVEKKLIIIKNAQIKVTYGLVKETASRKLSEARMVSDAGYLWYSDLNRYIYKMDTSGGIQSSFSGPLYPMGLAYDGTYFWISTPTDVYKYDTGGNQITYFSLDLFVGGGDLEWDNGYLWMVDGLGGTIYKMDTSGGIITQFSPPASSPEGITFDGTNLWISDGYTFKVYKVTKTGYVLSSFDAPGGFGSTPRSLAWDGSNLWLFIRILSGDKFFKVSTSGTEISQFDSSTDNPTGLTWQGGSTPQCSGTDTSCGTYPNCINCNSNDGCSGNYYRNYYCVSNSQGCSYTSDNCNDCSCSCGGYNTPETTANDNCNDGKDNDCDGKTDSADSGCPQQECTSGPCCDLSTNTFKSYGVQPTGYTDDTDGFCYGSNSPTGTSYVRTRDYYCNGNDADMHYSDTTVDTCGTCEYCTNNDLTCNYYTSSNTCGTKDCDYLDTTCRNYHDVNRYCAGTSGTCNDASCNSYTNAPAGTSCGQNKECDGNGNCIGTQQCTPGATCCDNNGNYRPSGYDCGTCKTCNGAGSCSQTPADDSDCGTIDCDGLDTTCRNYGDITSNRCEGLGDCKDPNTADCTSYTNSGAGTDCGTCRTCNGAGSCSSTPSDDSDCGTISCDDWHHIKGLASQTDTNYCYDSPDITSNRCEGFGDCKDSNTADCGTADDTQEISCGVCKYVSGCSGTTDGYCANYQEGTSCGEHMICDGNGGCFDYCKDGIKDYDEGGIDCGGSCPEECPYCIPIIKNGNPDKKIDVVFIADKSYNKNYTTLLEHATNMIRDHLGTINPVDDNLIKFNFYYVGDTAKSSKGCGDPPKKFWEKCEFADVIAILHLDEFGDCTRPGGIFTAEGFHTNNSFVHEFGHASFGLADEYEDNIPPYTYYFYPYPNPNIWPSLESCQGYADIMGWDRNDCHQFCRFEPACGPGWWSLNDIDIMGWDPYYDEWKFDYGRAGTNRIEWVFNKIDSGAGFKGGIPEPGFEKAIIMELNINNGIVTLLNSTIVYGYSRNYLDEELQFNTTIYSSDGTPLGSFSLWDPRIALVENGSSTPSWTDNINFTIVLPYIPYSEIVEMKNETNDELIEINITNDLDELCSIRDNKCDLDCPEGIDPDCPPIIKILSPTNNTSHNTSFVDLNWTVNKKVDWCGYSLDGGTNITITGGNIHCWGANYYDQLINYTKGDATQVSAGAFYTCILKSNGNVECRGSNSSGQSNPYNGGDATQVSAGWWHTCILKSDGNVECWGGNYSGESINYTKGDATQVSAGGSHTCILKSDGNVECRGSNSSGQSNPYNGGDATQVSAGGSHTCILKSDGNVECRGNNDDGQSNPYNGGDAIQVSASGYGFHTCVLKSNGNVECWGYNYDGQSINYTKGDATQVSASASHTCILKSNGNVECFGLNDSGQSTSYDDCDVTQVSAGAHHTCAITYFKKDITLTNLSEANHNVTIYCNDLEGNIGQSDYVYFTVDINEPPKINQILCQENNSIWENCSDINYNDLLSAIEINCSDPDNNIDYVNIRLNNLPDNKTIFDYNITTKTGDYWSYSSDILIEDSGNWNLTVICIDEDFYTDNDSISWYIPFGYLEPYLINPLNDTNVSKNEFFNFSSGVKCIGGECGDVNVTLDPIDSTPKTCSETWGFDCGTGPPEIGGDNTFDSCSNGVGYDESVEEIFLNVSKIYFGESIKVTCMFDPWASDDYYYIWYYNGTGWRNLLFEGPTGSLSFVNRTVDFIPDDVIGTHWVRCSINYYAVDNDGCSDRGSWYDNDDINLTVEGPIPKGVIPMNNGTPFYTINQNPTTCINMKAGRSCNTTWLVNATGEKNTEWKFYTIYTPINYGAYISPGETDKINIKILNRAPLLNLIDNITVNETDLVEIRVNASDPNGDALTYYINDSRFNQNNNIFTWQTPDSSIGIYIVNITVGDYEFNVSQLVTITISDVCIPNWIETNTTCKTNDTKIGYCIDENSCYDQTNLLSDLLGKPDNNTYECDYCSENIQDPFYTEWTQCNKTDSQSRIKYYIDLNYDTCCAVTGLDSDCHINNGSYVNTTEIQDCNYCTSTWQNINSSCLIDDTFITGYVYSNNCCEQTGLESDCNIPNNTTTTCNYCSESIIGPFNTSCMENDSLMQYYVDENFDSCCAVTNLKSDCGIVYNEPYYNKTLWCDYCTPYLTNTSWNDWANVSECYQNDTIIQMRNLTQHDINYCGEIENVTYYEFREGICDYCVPNWVEINTTCKPDNTIIGWYNDTNNCYAITGLESELEDKPQNNTYHCTYLYQYNITLNKNWNLISLPLKPLNNSITSVFKNINFSSIFTYNGTWLYYYNEINNNFNTIDITKGYWIDSLENQTLTIEGTEFTYPINFTLTKGWNLISYPSLNTTLINESLEDVNNTYNLILTYKDKKWLSYSPNKPFYLNTLKNFTPFYGYWVKVDENVTWTFDGVFR